MTNTNTNINTNENGGCMNMNDEGKLIMVRHGKCDYKVGGNFGEFVPENENDPLCFDGILNELGREQMSATAKSLLQMIDPTNKVVLVVSPKTRALQSCAMVRKELESAGFEVTTETFVEAMDLTLTHLIVKKFGPGWVDLWKEIAGDYKNVEKPKDFYTRIDTLIGRIQPLLVKGVTVIFVGHEEVLAEYLSRVYGIKKDGFSNAEVYEVKR